MRLFLVLSFLILSTAVMALEFEVPGTALIEKPPFALEASSKLSPGEREVEGIYKIEERVLSDGFLNRYEVKSEFGDYVVHGTALLKEQLNEIKQLADLKKTSTTSVVLNATGKASLDVLTAPARAIGSLISAVADPSGTWKTLKQVPSGVAGLFEYAGDEVSGVYKSVGTAVRGKKKDSNDARQQLQEKAQKESEKYALRWAGYSMAEKRWYSKLGVDPYTDNELLRAEIKRVAGAESAVNVIFKFIPGVGGVALVGDLNRVLKYSKDIAAFSDPNELRNKNLAALQTAGYSKASSEGFLKNTTLTPTLQTALVQMAIALAPVHGSDEILQQFVRSETKESAVILLESISYLTILNKVKPIKDLIPGFAVPVAEIEGVDKKSTAVVVLPTDTVFLTSTFLKGWARLLVELRARGIQSVEFRLRDTASPALRAALDQPDVFLFEKVEM